MAADGLVTIRARLGGSVKKMNLNEMQEMCDLRLALEGHSAALCAVNHSALDLRDILYALEGRVDARSPQEAANACVEAIERGAMILRG